MLKVIKKGYLNVSGNIYDPEYISLVTIKDNKITFSEHTVFIDSKQQEQLSSDTIKAFDEAVHIIKQNDKYGLVCNVPVKRHDSKKIVIHELVLPDRVQGMINNFSDYNAESSPVFLLHEQNIAYQEILSTIPAQYNFKQGDIEVWTYTQDSATKVLEYFRTIDALYVADGHHRIFASQISPIKKDCMSLIMSINDINIDSIPRVLPNIDSQTFEESLNMVESYQCKQCHKPLGKGVVKIKNQDKSLSLEFIQDNPNVLLNNDIYRLNTQILSYGFRVFDSQKLLYFNCDKEYNEYCATHKNYVGFQTAPMSKSELIEVFKSESIIPPKSTKISPKLPSLLIFKQYQE